MKKALVAQESFQFFFGQHFFLSFSLISFQIIDKKFYNFRKCDYDIHLTKLYLVSFAW